MNAKDFPRARAYIRERRLRREPIERFLELSLEMWRHTQGGFFTVLMRSFPSDKFNEWCDLARLLETTSHSGHDPRLKP